MTNTASTADQNNIIKLNIEQLRQETPGIAEGLVHFDNAGCSLPTRHTLTAIQSYLEKEAVTGGYRMVAENQSLLDGAYLALAELLNAQPSDIAITENATLAFNKALFALNLREGDVILTSKIEYGNNFLSYIKLREKGVMTRVADTFDPELKEFRAQIDDSVKLIAATHVPTQSGQIAPVEAIGRIARERKIPYLLDACQSAGQIPLDVDKIQCDFLSGTSRKYLRGPRGLGFLYVRPEMLARITPQQVEMLYANMTSLESFDLQPTVKMFETWERSAALIAGMGEAVRYANRLGVENIWFRIQTLAEQLRNGLRQINGVVCQDPKDGDASLCGIISFTKAGKDCEAIKEELTQRNINSTVALATSSLLDMQARGLEQVNRVSVHYYNTEQEIDRFLGILDQL